MEGDCPICLEKLKGKLHTTVCNHTFHTKCFGKLKKSSCPCCRAVFEKDKKGKILDMKNEIKLLINESVRNKILGKRLFSKISKEMKEMHTHLIIAIKKLQTIVKDKDLDVDLVGLVMIQTDEIRVMTILYEDKKKTVLELGKCIISDNEYYETLITLKKETLNEFSLVV